VLGIGNVGRRLVEGVVGVFALLGFLYVPLGRSTGYEHARAVLTTPAASAALADLTETASKLRNSAVAFVTRTLAPSEGSNDDAASIPSTQRPPGSKPPRPLPPELR
jgi:hypothetical protein